MSKISRSKDKSDVTPLNSARNQSGEHLHTPPVQGGAGNTGTTPGEEELMHHTVPFRQKPAAEFLKGNDPGIMQRYAPGAKASDVEGWVEDDETVERLAHWRREAPYG